MKKWKKTSPGILAAFEAAGPRDPRIARRPMFGYPSLQLGGNMFASTFEDDVVVRLSEEERRAALAREGAKPFEPMPGRPMKEYVVVPKTAVASRTALARWIARGLDYADTLAPKPRKTVAKKAKKRN